MEKTIKLSTLSTAIESACNNLRTNYSFTDEQCMEFVEKSDGEPCKRWMEN